MKKLFLVILYSIFLWHCTEPADSNHTVQRDTIQTKNIPKEEIPIVEKSTQKKEVQIFDWAGKYTYIETGNTNTGGAVNQWIFLIHIKKEGKRYTANYDVDGYQTTARLLLSGQEEEGKLVLYFDGLGEAHQMGYEGIEGNKYVTITAKNDGTFVVNDGSASMIFAKEIIQ